MTDPFPQSSEKHRLQEMNMAAPNKQPAGARPGPKAPNTHGPVAAGKPATSIDASGGLGGGVARPIKTAPTGKNANRLH